MIGKDLKKDESAYGVKFLLPDLNYKCNKNKEEFEKRLAIVDKKLEKEIRRTERIPTKVKDQNRQSDKEDSRIAAAKKIGANESRMSSQKNAKPLMNSSKNLSELMSKKNDNAFLNAMKAPAGAHGQRETKERQRPKDETSDPN